MLLDHNLLVIDQVTNWLTNDFAVRDGDGNQVGVITTEGGLGMRLLAGARELSLYEGEQKLLTLYDVPNFGFDTFEIQDAAGALVATVTKEFAFFATRLSIELVPDAAASSESAAEAESVELGGDWLDYDFEATLGGVRIAQVARRWPGLGEWFLDHNRYVVLFQRGLSTRHRVGILGAIIALDLIRDKQRRASH